MPYLSGLTDEGYGRGEAGSDVRGQAVLHGQPQVLQLALVEVGTRGGDVEHRRDARGSQSLPAGRVDGAAEEEEGQQLHRTVLHNVGTCWDSLTHSLSQVLLYWQTIDPKQWSVYLVVCWCAPTRGCVLSWLGCVEVAAAGRVTQLWVGLWKPLKST